MLIICGGFGMLGIAQAPGLADQQGERTISLHRHGRVVHFGPNALGEKLAVLLR
jgi:hypothetical protein